MDDACLICGHGLNRRPQASYCLKCGPLANRSNGAGRARGAVNRAVKSGKLPPVRTLQCVDCGAPARDYDHRDYNRPLDVQPVCRSCNLMRGPALPVEALRIPRPRADRKLPPHKAA